MRRQKNVCCFCKIKEIIKKKNYSDFYSIFTEKVIYLSEKERCLSEGRPERTCAYESNWMNKRSDTALQKKEEEKQKNTVLLVLAVLGAVAAVAGIAYAVYRYFTPDYLDDFDDDLDDDFDNYFDDEDEEDKETEE